VRWRSCSIALTLSLLAAPAASAQTPLAPGEIARVADTPVLKTDFDHWLTIAVRSSGEEPDEALRKQVSQLLISNLWLELEAARVGIVVSPGAVTTVYRRQKRKAFPREADFQRFLKRSGHTVADLKLRVRVDLLAERLRRHWIATAKTPRGQQRRLDRALARYTKQWRAKTVCAEGYVSEWECGTVVPAST
jgi:hypothetical protein